MRWIALVLLAVALFGCGQSEPKAAAPVSQANAQLPSNAGGQQLSYPGK
ncbi:MAG: hypothetical protein J0H02_18000 [Armatimonadetes bacterium]|nr:hypothetical protein [Armatimonadota bacterium]